MRIDPQCNFAVLLWSVLFDSLTAMSSSFHFLIAIFSFLNPLSHPPLHIVLVFCGILRAPLECYHIGLVCVLTEFSGLM